MPEAEAETPKPNETYTVIRDEKYTISPKLGERKVVRMITYTSGELPPRTIQIPEDKYTKELEKKMVKEDIEKAKARAMRTETL